MSHEGGAAPQAISPLPESGAAGGDSASLLKLIRQGRSFSGHEPHCAFLNTHQMRFADISAASGLDLDDDGRAVGVADWDGDGDLDLWIVNRNGPQLRFLQNNMPRKTHFLALRLRGTSCNRDAIGARVQLIAERAGDAVQIKTLRAGDGYLAQSSKWLHFGLGRDAGPCDLVVIWPNGEQESFTGLPIDRRYVIEQGSGQAIEVPGRPAPARLLPSDAHYPSPPAELQVLSVSDVHLPRLRYRTFDGQLREVFTPGSGHPVLLNLWAPWCQPCMDELSELVRRHEDITHAGLDIVALSVSDPDEDGADADDQESLARLQYPYRHGRADGRLVEVLQIVNNHLFDLHLPLPVPTSVLIDGDGRLVALYKGRVSVDRVLRDVSLIGQPAERRREAGSPFSGRWFEPLNRISMIPLLDEWIAAGFLEEADDFVRRMPEARKEHLLPALVRLGMAFYRQGDGARAQEHFAVAVRIDPSFVGVETALGMEREKEGRPESAVKLYREALRRNPQSIAALNNFAWLLATHPDASIRDGNEAVRLGEQAAQLTGGKDPAILDTLAAAYAARGDYDQAVRVAGAALDLAKQRGRLRLAQQIAARIASYQDRQPIRRSGSG